MDMAIDDAAQDVPPPSVQTSGRGDPDQRAGLADGHEPSIVDRDIAGRPARGCHDDATFHDEVRTLLHGPSIMARLYTRWVARRFRFRQVDVFTDTPLCGNPLAVFVDASASRMPRCRHLPAR